MSISGKCPFLRTAAGRPRRAPADLEPEETARALVLMTERHLLDAFGPPERTPSHRESAAVFATLEEMWAKTLYG